MMSEFGGIYANGYSLVGLPSVEDVGSPLSGTGSGGSRISSRFWSTNPTLIDSESSRMKMKLEVIDEYSVSTFHTALHMEDHLWAALPDDLLYEILARIPPFVILQLRSVCKTWNSILQGSTFLQFHSQVRSHGRCLVTCLKSSKTPQCSVFSFPLKAWYSIPFSFLPPWAFSLVGSSGGLVCFSGLDGNTFRILVCNPLTRAWRTLPTMHSNLQRQLIMVGDCKDRSFKLIATDGKYGGNSLPTEVYDSKSNSWSTHQMMSAVKLCPSKMAFCESRLYLLKDYPLCLMMYRLDTGQWEQIPAKFPLSMFDGYLVAGMQKRLFLVGRISLHSTIQSMRIWELDHTKSLWVEISRMPPRYFRSLPRLSAVGFGQDNLICFTSWIQGKGLLFDVDKKVWSCIDGSALKQYSKVSNQVCFYEPRFDASIN